MDLSKTGKLIACLRKEKNFTQKELAQKLSVCPKTVSKWETGHGFPDLSLIDRLSKIFEVDISKLIDGELPKTKPEAGNVKKIKFYLCGKCGNVLTSTGNAEVICCGRRLEPLEAKATDDVHQFSVEQTEDDFYVKFSHPMTKEHYIIFAAYVSIDRVLIIRLYPEQDGELRFPRMYGGKMYLCCNKHGLFEYQ